MYCRCLTTVPLPKPGPLQGKSLYISDLCFTPRKSQRLTIHSSPPFALTNLDGRILDLHPIKCRSLQQSSAQFQDSFVYFQSRWLHRASPEKKNPPVVHTSFFDTNGSTKTHRTPKNSVRCIGGNAAPKQCRILWCCSKDCFHIRAGRKDLLYTGGFEIKSSSFNGTCTNVVNALVQKKQPCAFSRSLTVTIFLELARSVLHQCFSYGINACTVDKVRPRKQTSWPPDTFINTDPFLNDTNLFRLGIELLPARTVTIKRRKSTKFMRGGSSLSSRKLLCKWW